MRVDKNTTRTAGKNKVNLFVGWKICICSSKTIQSSKHAK